jgi:alkylation response protein AidB-like acyl-CoA dehydrogenase
MANSTGLSAEVRTFLEHHPPGAPPADLDGRFEWLVAYQRRLHEAGLAVVTWPERFGGRGLSPLDAVQVAEELGAERAPEVINFVAIEVVAPALMAYASEDQLRRWLPPMASAESVWCQLFSEPDAGSDLASLRTKAEKDGDVWRINGAKVWSTWAQFAQKGLLLARTGPLDTRHRTIGAFVIDMDQPGIDVRPLVTMTGAAEFAEVVFTDAVVRDEDVVGDVAKGWSVAMRMLENERGPYALRRVAVLSSGMSRLHEHARKRRLEPGLRRRVIDATVALRLLELRARKVAFLLEAGAPLGAESTLTKVALTEAEQLIFSVAFECLGMDGVAWPVDHGGQPEEVDEYLYSRAASIYGGSSEIQRNVLAERFLGLPPEPRSG